MISTIHDPYDTLQARHEERRQAARQRWPEYPAADLDNRSGYLIDKGSGLLFEPDRHVVFARHVEVDRPEPTSPASTTAGQSFTSSSAPATPAPSPNSRRWKRQARTPKQEREQAQARFLREQPRRTLAAL